MTCTADYDREKWHPPSRQRGRPHTGKTVSVTNKNLVLGPQNALDTKADWPIDRRS
jgi:hypothetical protein